MEVDLSDKIKIMAKWGFALTKPEIQAIVQTYVQENHRTRKSTSSTKVTEMKLPQPEIESKACRISQQYWSPIDFEKYVVQ
ncbi:unnamed protein product [Acanthoscelides obtectus]|uniref:Uncharacterized protein n=1 Tax=Acanthoscelides obtectus TaxID=200917 RepID=A0A9P0QAQ5_ACAOB|nr:unnamed protein product [Acanthoscelides obtectus]CAH2016128.1 unnamed protein product [Acanthoscelides obtectus]CAK1635311.1 hypothetical protein AOBTE_LOCUS9193 [Acanthoscelides obtectus]CAK1635352.1 hypothetical protein AOBTE_LOCUS9224 [Acanthoscelides obtectus]